jgi:membrane protease YdiL (CAAX protease family)
MSSDKSPANFFRRHTWAVFLAHQSLLFASAFGFLSAVRSLTGRDIHLGREPVGALGGAALLLLSAALVALTWALYRWTCGREAPSLGLRLTRGRAAACALGAFAGFVLAAWPWAVGLWTGDSFVRDHVGAHFDGASVAVTVAWALVLLFASAFTEEVVNRAFPMRLWRHRSLAFRVLVPSLFFAAAHLAGEPFGAGRFAALVAGGVAQSLAYALAGHVWLPAGLHFGANFAGFSASGLWHAGAVVEVVGRPLAPGWTPTLLILLVSLAAFALRRRDEKDETAAHETSHAL